VLGNSERSNGRVFIYKRNITVDSFELFDTLVAPRNFTNFGFSVDMYNNSLIVGANGYYIRMFENNPSFDHRNWRTYVCDMVSFCNKVVYLMCFLVVYLFLCRTKE
jgi:hypothetical protein